jgi:hypothetical protein
MGTRVEGLVEGEPRPSLDEALSGFGRDSSAKEGSVICSDLSDLGACIGACMHGGHQNSDVCMNYLSGATRSSQEISLEAQTEAMPGRSPGVGEGVAERDID